MLIIKSVAFIVLMLFMSFYAGNICIREMQDKERNLAIQFVAGILMMFASFYIICMIMTFLKRSLTEVAIFWLFSMLVLLLLNSWRKKTRTFQAMYVNFKLSYVNCCWIIATCLILFQILYICIMSHTDADDATYVGMAATSFFTDTLNEHSPLTGLAFKWWGFRSYALSPFPIFWAMWGRMLNLHPAIIMHTLCPIVLLAFAYAVYYLIGEQIAEKTEDIPIFLIIISLINMWGDFSIRSASTFLLYRIWQGKAVVAAILIPLIFYLLLQIRRGKDIRVYKRLLILCSISTCLLSGMGIILVGGLLAVSWIVELLYFKKFDITVKYILAEIPLGLVAIIYLFLGE